MLYGEIVDKQKTALALAKDVKDVTDLEMAAIAWPQYASGQTPAVGYVNGFKEDYGTGLCTRILIFNASGRDLTFVQNGDDSGHMWRYPPDSVIGNGQWSYFLHVKTAGAATGSVGWFAYDAGVVGKEKLILTFSWKNPFSSENAANLRSDAKSGWTTNDAKFWVDSELRTRSGSCEHRPWVMTWEMGDDSSPLLIFTVRQAG